MAVLPVPPARYRGALAACVLALVAFAAVAVYGEHGLVHLREMDAQQAELERVAFDLQQRNEHLRERIDRLQNDDSYLEQVARERLGLVKPGEIVYRAKPPISE